MEDHHDSYYPFPPLSSPGFNPTPPRLRLTPSPPLSPKHVRLGFEDDEILEEPYLYFDPIRDIAVDYSPILPSNNILRWHDTVPDNDMLFPSNNDTGIDCTTVPNEHNGVSHDGAQFPNPILFAETDVGASNILPGDDFNLRLRPITYGSVLQGDPFEALPNLETTLPPFGCVVEAKKAAEYSLPSFRRVVEATETPEYRLPPRSPSPSFHSDQVPRLEAGHFKCNNPGCTALPCQTHSHIDIHSQDRPHYCPVAGCPRSEGGKGFKRKNEMIRHGLVHSSSPVYVCPFCPDQDYRYPRPADLQRHVRVYHTDKDKDDPLLREFLAQRPEGGSRGRRRRNIATPGVLPGEDDTTNFQSLLSIELVSLRSNSPYMALNGADKLEPIPREIEYLDTQFDMNIPRETFHSIFETDTNLSKRTFGRLDDGPWSFGLKDDELALLDASRDEEDVVSGKSTMDGRLLGPPRVNFPADDEDEDNIYGLDVPVESSRGVDHSQSEIGVPTAELEIHRSTDAVPEVPFSDSGYGTVSHCSRQIAQLAVFSNANLVDANNSPSSQAQISQKPDAQYDTNESLDAIDDSATVYSDAGSLSDFKVNNYVSVLAEDLVKRLDLKVLNDHAVERLATTLPGLLKALALKFGSEPTQMHRDVMYFIHKHRHAITEYIKSSMHRHDTQEDLGERPRGETASKEVMNRWLGSKEDFQYEQYDDEHVHERDSDSEDDEPFEEDENEELSPTGMEEYQKLISKDPGYEWLLDRLRRDILLSPPEQDVMNKIRMEILKSCCSTRRISRKESSQGYKVRFYIDWNPFAFLDEQEYDEPDAQAIANAITLTGSCKDAQALSCREYLTQTWPSTGPCIIQLIQKLLRDRDGFDETEAVGHTTNGTRLKAWFFQSHLFIEALGVPDFVAEIGEVLAWLGAALRPSSRSSGAAYSIPFIERNPACTPDDPNNSIKDLRFDIKFETKDCEGISDLTNGQCWYALFRKPLIVRGFPIPRKSENETGLDIPLSMLAAINNTRTVEMFNRKVFLKGFSSMLVPTKKCKDMLVWHLLYNKHSCNRISYLDCGVEHADVKIADLERTRHVVGWCSEAVSTVGTLKANYNIKKSNLPNAHSVYTLEQAQISGGQFITGTAVFSLGKNEKPVHISRFGYMTKMQWISSKFVNLWDEGDKRGWLVNGTTALLHILRASLAHSKRKFSSAFLMNLDDLLDTNDHKDSNSILKLLIDEKNRDLKLYVDRSDVFVEETKVPGGLQSRIESKKVTRYYRLEDRIEHIYNMLEKLFDHQTDVERKSGIQINQRPRRQLEGWDFRDLVTDGDPFFPRVATIQALGKGWIDFTRSIRTVTLFGRGFGDLIEPKRRSTAAATSSAPVNTCSRWTSLPKGRYYLATCISNLREIMENSGDDASNPITLCENVLWHMRQTTFQPCPCIANRNAKHHDPVQTLFPSKFKTMLRKKSQVTLKNDGAVIFGHNANLHWHWKDSGDPVKGDPPQDAGDTTAFSDDMDDSGLGSSLGSSSSPSQINSGSGSDGDDGIGSTSPATSVSSNPTTSPAGNGTANITNTAGSRGLKRCLQTVMPSISKRMKFHGGSDD